MLPKVAIVYLSYNVRPYLEQVFLSLERLEYPKERLSVLVVDNASTDGSAEWIRAHALPGMTYFPSATNEGFAGGNNVGMNRALLDGADYVYLLNGDAKLDPRAIREAVDAAERNAKVGAAQSLIRLWQDEAKVNVTGGMVHFLGFGFARDNGRVMTAEDVAPLDGSEIAYASGAAVLYRAAALREVGLLESFYFMYHDDLELGWRLRLAGYKNVLAVRSVAYHHYEFRRSIKKLYWMERARLVVFFSHLKIPTLLLLAPFLFALELALLAFAAKGGWLRDKLCVYLDLLRPATWRHIAEKRAFDRQIRRVGDREIVRLWTGTIDHQETKSLFVDAVANPLLRALWTVLRACIVW